MTEIEQLRRLLKADDLRMQWQYRRLAAEIPLALLLVQLSIRENGWPVTYYWLKFFSVNISILVALTRKIKWM